MYDSRHKTLLERGDALFSDKVSLNSLHQEIAENFYVERADFTRMRYLGADFAAGLTSSYPLMVRRELGDAISAILRPQELEWFEVTVEDDDNLDKAGKEWLQMATKRQRRAMYDRQSQFVRAAKQGDHDFATFGQTVVTCEYNAKAISLLYRTWHLRDCAWTEAYDGSVDELHIKWNPRAFELKDLFSEEKLHENVRKCLSKEPNKRIGCRRVVLLKERYETVDRSFVHDWVIVYIDVDNKWVMSEQSIRTRGAVVPRWLTVSGSQYAYSPATVAGLPDARLIQAMTLTLLEAGEMAVRPPMLASKDILREDVNNFAGGITYFSGEYDKRKTDILRPLNQDKSHLPFGWDMNDRTAEMLASAFYLNKITLPPADQEMTAYETSERIKEYIRQARPLFEPMEHEYNYGLCDVTFEELLHRGTFGSLSDIPGSVRGRKTSYKFQNPLHDAVERQKSVTFLEAKQMVREAYDLDPVSASVMDARSALRDALGAIRTPEQWLRSAEEVDEMAERMAAMQSAQQEASTVQQAAEAADVLKQTL